MSINLSELGRKQAGRTNISCRDLAILLFTQSRAQGNVDTILLARWRTDPSAPVKEAEDTLRCLAPRIINEQREYARSFVSLQVLLGDPAAAAVAATEEAAEARLERPMQQPRPRLRSNC